MSRMPVISLMLALLTASALLTALPLCAQPAASPRPLGLIIDSHAVPNAIPFARFVDVMVETLSASRQWEPTVLTEDSPLVRVSGAPWPNGKNGWGAATDTLSALLIATGLSDVLVISPLPTAVNTVDVFWLQAEQPEMKRLQMMAGGGDTAYAGMAKQLIDRLQESYAAAPAAPAKTPAAAPTPAAPAAAATTPPPAVPAAPAPVVAAAGGSPASAPVARPSDPATAPKAQPAAALPAPVELTEPATAVSRPGPAPVKPTTPETPAAQPAPAPVTAVAPVLAPSPPVTEPVPAPPLPATEVVPAPVTPPAAPAPPKAPEAAPQFLAAADKFLGEGDFRRVEDLLLKADEAREPKASIYYGWARLEAARQNRTAERTWLERTIAADPDNLPAHLRLAELLRGAGLWRKAAEEYDLVIKAQPDNVFAYLGLSALYAAHSQPRRAAEILAEAVKHHPEDISLYLRLGDLHVQRKALPEAEEAYDRAARLAQGEQRADALDRLGDLYVGADREREGFICYAEASKLRSESNSPLAQKRYQQIMGAADDALGKVLDKASQTLDGYLSGRNVTREEAFGAMSDFNTQVQEVSNFVESITPPTNLKLTHAERKLAYSLAAEAALYGLLYLDQGKRDELGLYQSRLAESRKNLQALQRP
ncbi:MAG: tetratricopeptide repeat protein [Armatimonadota bacterium]